MLKEIFFWETSTLDILLSNRMLIVRIHSTSFSVAALMFETCLPSFSEQDWNLQKRLPNKPCNTTEACWQSLRHFLLLLPSSGHTFFVKLRFSLQEIVTKAEDQKKKKKRERKITCSEQLISVSCICMSAKILPYTETQREDSSKTSSTHRKRLMNLCCITYGFTWVCPRPILKNFILWNAQSTVTPKFISVL